MKLPKHMEIPILENLAIVYYHTFHGESKYPEGTIEYYMDKLENLTKFYKTYKKLERLLDEFEEKSNNWGE